MSNSAGKYKSSEQSRDDYLEAILIILDKQGVCRSVDIANRLGVTKPSVSVAVHKLSEEGYIELDLAKEIYLTDKGREHAKETYNRHRFFKSMLMRAGIDPETAEDEACELEHCISHDSFKKLLSYYGA